LTTPVPNSEAGGHPTTLVIVPAFNEAATITGVIEELQTCAEPVDVLVIDDGSTDATAGAAVEAGARVLRLPFNCGIGAGVQAGLRAALGGLDRDYAAVARIDGDGQHDPAVLSELLAALREGPADFAIGSRYVTGEGFQSTAARRAGTRWFSLLLDLVCRLQIRDPTSGCWAANPRAAALLAAESSSDYPEVDSLVRLARYGCVIVEVPTIMRARVAGHTSIAGPRALYYMVKVTIALLVGRVRSRN
jgi:glycosyltransferase involved in cell wall biosynthesis